MAIKFKKGDVVQLDLSIPSGPVIGFKINDAGEVSYLMEWVDNDGSTKQRWFREDELKLA